MRPLGWRRRRARQAVAETLQRSVREEAERIAEELTWVKAARRHREERTITFANSSWKQLEEIASNRGISNRDALAEAIAVWQQMSREVKHEEHLRFTVGGRESHLMTIRRGIQ